MTAARAGLWMCHADPHKSGSFEKGTDVAHLSKSFDPRNRAEFAGSTYKVTSNPSPAKSWMNHNTRKHVQLVVKRSHCIAFPATAQSEVAIAECERLRRRLKNADPNRILVQPKHKHPANQGEFVAAIMPPSEVRPVGFGGWGDPHVVDE